VTPGATPMSCTCCGLTTSTSAISGLATETRATGQGASIRARLAWVQREDALGLGDGGGGAGRCGGTSVTPGISRTRRGLVAARVRRAPVPPRVCSCADAGDGKTIAATATAATSARVAPEHNVRLLILTPPRPTSRFRTIPPTCSLPRPNANRHTARNTARPPATRFGWLCHY
jgi:hypothetical protein